MTTTMKGHQRPTELQQEDPPRRPPHPTRREAQILRLGAIGYTVPEIASELDIAVSTVKNHLSAVYAKLDARNRVDAIMIAIRVGVIDLDDVLEQRLARPADLDPERRRLVP